MISSLEPPDLVNEGPILLINRVLLSGSTLASASSNTPSLPNGQTPSLPTLPILPPLPPPLSDLPRHSAEQARTNSPNRPRNYTYSAPHHSYSTSTSYLPSRTRAHTNTNLNTNSLSYSRTLNLTQLDSLMLNPAQSPTNHSPQTCQIVDASTLLHAVQQDPQRIFTRIQQLFNDTNVLLARLSTTQTSLKNTTTQLSMANQSNETLLSELKDLKSENDGLRADFTSMRENYEKLLYIQGQKQVVLWKFIERIQRGEAKVHPASQRDLRSEMDRVEHVVKWERRDEMVKLPEMDELVMVGSGNWNGNEELKRGRSREGKVLYSEAVSQNLVEGEKQGGKDKKSMGEKEVCSSSSGPADKYAVGGSSLKDTERYPDYAPGPSWNESLMDKKKDFGYCPTHTSYAFGGSSTLSKERGSGYSPTLLSGTVSSASKSNRREGDARIDPVLSNYIPPCSSKSKGKGHSYSPTPVVAPALSNYAVGGSSKTSTETGPAFSKPWDEYSDSSTSSTVVQSPLRITYSQLKPTTPYGWKGFDPSAQTFIPVGPTASIPDNPSLQHMQTQSKGNGSMLNSIQLDTVANLPPRFYGVCPISLVHAGPCPISGCRLAQLCPNYNNDGDGCKWFNGNVKDRKPCPFVHEYMTCERELDEGSCALIFSKGDKKSLAKKHKHLSKRVHRGNCTEEEWRQRVAHATLRDPHRQGKWLY